MLPGVYGAAKSRRIEVRRHYLRFNVYKPELIPYPEISLFRNSKKTWALYLEPNKHEILYGGRQDILIEGNDHVPGNLPSFGDIMMSWFRQDQYTTSLFIVSRR